MLAPDEGDKPEHTKTLCQFREVFKMRRASKALATN
jgi:hypothetical protein